MNANERKFKRQKIAFIRVHLRSFAESDSFFLFCFVRFDHE